MTEKEKALSSFRWLESQRLVFVACFLIGSIGVIAIRLITDSVIAAILYAAASMFVYVFVGASKKYVIRPDVIGDNSYYLGFLFTLVSLAFTLYKYSSANGSDQIDTIIQNFGLALSTTLIGLVLRVYFNQTNEDPDVFQKAIRMSLAEEASNLIGETAKIRNDVSVLRTSIQQSIEESINASFDKFSEQINASAERYFELVDSETAKVTTQLRSTIGELGTSVATLEDCVRSGSQSITSALDGFKESSGEMVLELRSVAAKIRNIKSLDEVVQQKIAEPIAHVERSVKQLIDTLEAVSLSGTNASANIDEFGAGVVRLASEDIELLTSRVRALANDLSGWSGFSSKVQPRANVLVDDLQGLSNALKDSSERVSYVNRDLNTSVASSMSALDVLKRDVELAAKKLAENNPSNG